MNTNIFNIEKLEIDKVRVLGDNDGAVRHLTITTSEGMSLDFALFADSKEALEIETQNVVKI